MGDERIAPWPIRRRDFVTHPQEAALRLTVIMEQGRSIIGVQETAFQGRPIFGRRVRAGLTYRF